MSLPGQPVSQSVIQSDSQSVSQSVSGQMWTASQTVGRSVSQLLRQSVGQSVSLAICRSESQSGRPHISQSIRVHLSCSAQLIKLYFVDSYERIGPTQHKPDIALPQQARASATTGRPIQQAQARTAQRARAGATTGRPAQRAQACEARGMT